MDTNVNVQPDTLAPDVREMSTNVFPIRALLWEHRSVSNSSTTTTAFAVPDGWVATVKREETFAKEILAKTEAFAPTKKDHTIVLVSQATSVPIANSLVLHATAPLAAMVGPASTVTTAKTSVVAVLLELLAKLANKTLVTNARIILARTKVTASTELETTTAPASLSGGAKIVTSTTVQVPAASTNRMAATRLSTSTWKSKNV